MTERNPIERVAKRLLSRTEQHEPPVNVEEIARVLGARIEYAELDDDCSGVLVRKDDNAAVIGVNWSHHPNRQRFTIAHEIGHYCLHEGGTYVDKGTYARYRDEESGSGTIREEREANRFAAALLMPSEWVRTAFYAQPFDPADDDALTQLAETFKVSPQAMMIRLSGLRLLSF